MSTTTTTDTTTTTVPATTETILANEQKWQDKWKTDHVSAAPTDRTDKESFYVLPMFPYPSGNLHMGHVRVYTISDCLARYRRLKGFHVLHPIGWDAFGLPAENAARQNNVEPSDWTVENIERMKNQLSTLGFDFDWDKEVTTCQEDYYRWTQWLFTELHDAGLAYRAEAVVNWDPVDCTVLANEQIDADGRSWRSGAVAERKRLNQWFFRITDYADELLSGLDTLEQWPEQVKQMQRNWIGRSEGTEIHFDWPLSLPSIATPTEPTKPTKPTKPLPKIPIFTTRADTLMGVTFVAVAPSHPLVAAVLDHQPDSDVFTAMDTDILAALIDAVSNNAPPPTPAVTDGDGLVGKGFDLGVTTTHPITGEEIPIFVADYVISDYGHAAVMGVPGHDERDYHFAQTHGIQVKTVLTERDAATGGAVSTTDVGDALWTETGTLINSGEMLNGMTSEQAMVSVGNHLLEQKKGNIIVGRRVVSLFFLLICFFFFGCVCYSFAQVGRVYNID